MADLSRIPDGQERMDAFHNMLDSQLRARIAEASPQTATAPSAAYEGGWLTHGGDWSTQGDWPTESDWANWSTYGRWPTQSTGPTNEDSSTAGANSTNTRPRGQAGRRQPRANRATRNRRN